MPHFKYTIFLITILIFAVIDISAQDNNRKKFALNGHEFISTGAVKSGNIQTMLTSKLGMGSTGQLVSKGIIIDGQEILNFTGSLLYASANVTYKQKVNDWFAIYFDIDFVGRVGTQVPTLLAEGVNTAGGSEVGWLFKLNQHEKGYLSGSVFTMRYAGSIINLGKYIEEIIDENPNAKVIEKVPVTMFGGRLNYAYAFNKIWGAQFDAGMAYGEDLLSDKKSMKIDLGVFGEANLYPETKIPLGFGLGYNLTSLPETIYDEERMANVFYFNMAYTKGSDFELCLEVHTYTVPLTSYKTTPRVIAPSLIMRFNF